MASRPRDLPIDWVKHLKTEAEKKEFKAAVKNDRLVLGRLADIIEEKLTSVKTKEMSVSEYDEPSWAYKQAHMNGFKAGLTAVLRLLP